MIDPNTSDDFVPDRITGWRLVAVWIVCAAISAAFWWGLARVLL